MSELIGSFISIDESNKNTSKSYVQQLVDIVQADIASTGSTTRKSYEVFVSGGLNLNSISSSLYQTVFDQDFTLGTSNPLFDISIGSYEEKVVDSSGIESAIVNTMTASYDSAGKLTGFADPDNVISDAVMMREKVNIYKQFAQNLLGDSNAAFVTPHGEVPPAAPTGSLDEAKQIKGAIFICFRRLFTRDNIYKGSFAMKLHKRATNLYSDFLNDTSRETGVSFININTQADVNSSDNNVPVIYDDRVANTNISVDVVAGEVSTLVDDSGNPVGLIYYDRGIIVLDAERALDPDQIIRGLIDSTKINPESDSFDRSGPYYVFGTTASVNEGATQGYIYPVYTSSTVNHSDPIAIDIINSDSSTDSFTFYHDASTSKVILEADNSAVLRPDLNEVPEYYPVYKVDTTEDYYSSQLINDFDAGNGQSYLNGKLYPELWVRGTIDTVLDHVCETRFGRGNLSAISFRNETVINSSLIFCNAGPTQLNYSTNPTYTKESGDIIALNGTEPFSYVTTVGLYDADRFLLAVAKLSRPIEKNPETSLSIRVRLDY